MRVVRRQPRNQRSTGGETRVDRRSARRTRRERGPPVEAAEAVLGDVPIASLRDGQVLSLSSGAGEGRCRELEVGDITRGVKMRRQTSPVEESTERNKDDVVVGVSGRQEAVAVVGLQAGAQLPDGSGIRGRRGGHLVEEEESREETGLNE